MKRKKGEKQTERFRESGEVGVGKGKGSDLGDRKEFLWMSDCKRRKWGPQGNGEEGH